jgi:hypothetical protein
MPRSAGGPAMNRPPATKSSPDRLGRTRGIAGRAVGSPPQGVAVSEPVAVARCRDRR